MKEKKKTLQFNSTVQQQSLSSITTNLDNMDLLAIAILRIGYGDKDPSFVNFPTVACLTIDNELWYAQNMFDIEPDDVVKIYNSLKSPYMPSIEAYRIYLDENNGEGNDKNTHAEMKLLFELVNSGKLKKGIQIGISKPACTMCNKVLQYNGFKVSWTHTRKVTTWSAPKIADKYLPGGIK